MIIIVIHDDAWQCITLHDAKQTCTKVPKGLPVHTSTTWVLSRYNKVPMHVLKASPGLSGLILHILVPKPMGATQLWSCRYPTYSKHIPCRVLLPWGITPKVRTPCRWSLIAWYHLVSCFLYYNENYGFNLLYTLNTIWEFSLPIYDL